MLQIENQRSTQGKKNSTSGNYTNNPSLVLPTGSYLIVFPSSVSNILSPCLSASVPSFSLNGSTILSLLSISSLYPSPPISRRVTKRSEMEEAEARPG